MKDNNKASGISDELIMAYVDGELEPEQANEVSAAIAADKHLQQREMLFRETASVLGYAFDAPMHEEVPDRLLAVLRKPEKKSIGDRLGEFFSNFGAGIAPLPATAMALVAVLGVAVILNGNRQDTFSEKSIIEVLKTSEFSQVLASTVSGITEKIMVGSNEAEVVPLFTFQDKQQRYCRYFELSVVGKPIVGQGISCQNLRGAWKAEAFSVDRTEQKNGEMRGKQSYELASGENRIERIVESMRAGEPLRLEEERRCIDKGWKACK